MALAGKGREPDTKQLELAGNLQQQGAKYTECSLPTVIYIYK